jgi:hypothetical protein
LSEVSDKLSVEVGEPEEGLYALNSSWSFLFLDRSYFLWVYLDPLPSVEDKPEVFCCLYFKFALLDIYL